MSPAHLLSVAVPRSQPHPSQPYRIWFPPRNARAIRKQDVGLILLVDVECQTLIIESKNTASQSRRDARVDWDSETSDSKDSLNYIEEAIAAQICAIYPITPLMLLKRKRRGYAVLIF